MLVANALPPKPNPKLLVAAFYGENKPPPGPNEPDPATV